jgi:hypothetical protein
MARGWDSKSVEEQIEAAAAEKTVQARPCVTAEERDRLARRSSLLLARAKTARDLDATRDLRYRAILEQALAHLDAQLAGTVEG